MRCHSYTPSEGMMQRRRLKQLRGTKALRDGLALALISAHPSTIFGHDGSNPT